MTLSCIVAVSANGVIGRAGDLPWHLPEDLKRFKQLTMGHPIIMGRKTYQSIGRPLRGRRAVVLARSAAFVGKDADAVGSLEETGDAPGGRAGVLVAGSLDRALDACRDEDEVFVIGGASVFAEALPRATTVYLTRVHAEIEGDTFFPEDALVGFELVEEEHHQPDARHAFAFSFQTYRRRER